MTFGRKIQEWRERRAEESARVRGGVIPTVRPIHRGVYAGGTTGAAPKEEPYRDAALLEMARGRPCLMLVPGVCNHRTDSTVAAHENEGKGMGIKAPDHRSVWACYACHTFYDQGPAPRGYKRELFAAAMQMQEQAWEQVAKDKAEPDRLRRAARRALERLDATPLTEEA